MLLKREIGGQRFNAATFPSNAGGFCRNLKGNFLGMLVAWANYVSVLWITSVFKSSPGQTGPHARGAHEALKPRGAGTTDDWTET